MSSGGHAAKQWFLADVPLSDAAADAFGHADVADNLVTMIREQSHDRLMIGLTGEFGVGKSTVIELLRSALMGDSTLAVVRLSAERHEPVGLHRALVFAFAEKLVDAKLLNEEKAKQILERLEYSSSQTASDITSMPAVRLLRRFAGTAARKLLTRFLFWIVGVITALILIGVVLALLGVDVGALIGGWLGGVALWLTIAGPAITSLWSVVKDDLGSSFFKSGQINKIRPRVEAADEYERTFASLVSAVSTRLVIAVDDIDRLSETDVLDALNAVRSFQLTCRADRRPILIVSIDEAVVASAIQRSGNRVASVAGATDEAVEAFLDRLFVQRQPMPPHARTDMREFALSKLDPERVEGASLLKAELSSIAAILMHDGVADPRHVIRLLNAFFANYRLAKRRESREGPKAIAKGEVTAHPKVLARVTALRVDFPDFFERLRRETGLLAAIERQARGEVSDNDRDLLASSGFVQLHDGTVSIPSDLLNFVGRTNGWVEEVPDLLPFIYLGQSAIERTVGSSEARRVSRMLVNGQSAEFRSYLEELSEATEERQINVGNLITATLSSVPDLDLGNSLKVLSDTVDALPATIKTQVANAFGTALAQSAGGGLRAGALIELAEASSESHLPPVYLGRLLNPSDDEEGIAWAATVLQHLPELQRMGFVDEATNYVQSSIEMLRTSNSLKDLEQWFERIPQDPPATIAITLAERVLDVLKNTAEQPGSELVDAIATLLQGVAKSTPMGQVSGKAADVVHDAPGSTSATAALQYLLLLEAVPEALSSASRKLATGLIEGEEIDEDAAPNLDDITRVFTRTLSTAPDAANRKGSTRARTSTLISEFLGTRISSEGEVNDVVWASMQELVKSAKGEDIAPLVSPLMTVWQDSQTEELADHSHARTLAWVVAHLDLLAGSDAQLVVGVVSNALLPGAQSSKRSLALSLTPEFYATIEGAASADATASTLSSNLSSTSTTNDLIRQSLGAIMSNCAISPSTEVAILNRIGSAVYPYDRSSALSLATHLPWSAESLPSVLTTVNSWGSPIADNDLNSLARTAVNAGVTQLPENLRALMTRHALDLASGTEDQRRAAAQLIPLLSIVDAIDVVWTSESGIEQLRVKLSEGDADETVVEAFFEQLRSNPSMPYAATIAGVLSGMAGEFGASVIEAAQTQLETRTTDLDSEAWKVLIGAIDDSTARAVADAVSTALQSAAADALPAASIISGIATNPTFDALLAPAARRAMTRWIKEVPSPEVAAPLAQAFAAGPVSAAQAMQDFGSGGPKKPEAARVAFTEARRFIPFVGK